MAASKSVVNLFFGLALKIVADASGKFKDQGPDPQVDTADGESPRTLGESESDDIRMSSAAPVLSTEYPSRVPLTECAEDEAKAQRGGGPC